MKNIFQLHLDNQTRKPQNLVNVSEASIYIYDIISADWGVSAASVIEALAQIGDVETLNVYVNSPGGDVFEGRAIMAALSRFKGNTVAHIDSLCASAATSIALSCNTVNMSEGALFMIHNASGMAWGDKTEMRATADLLQKIELSIVKDYTDKTGMEDTPIIEMMDAETWMTASEALKLGFVDSITSKAKASNAWNLSSYRNAPKDEPIVEPPEIIPEPIEIEQPTSVGFFMSETNTNRLRIATIA
jgi:ATP-dependent Clp protease protease subunit